MYVREFDDDGYKAPISTFTNFVVCSNCNALMLNNGDKTECHLCGPGKAEFNELVAEIYLKYIKKEQEAKILESINKNPVCKVCNKIH